MKLKSLMCLCLGLALGGAVRADIPITRVAQCGTASYAITVSGNRACVGMGNKLAVLDISTPSTPTILGQSAPVQDVARSITVSGDYAYVADGSAGLAQMGWREPPRFLG